MSVAVDISNWGPTPPRWVRLLAAEVAASNRTLTGQRIGMSRSAVSLALANRYPSPSTERMERRVLAALDRRECPARDAIISTQQCREYRARPAPTHNPQSMQAWRRCQQCPHHPDNGDAS